MDTEKVIAGLIDANARLIKENNELAKEVATVKALACNEARCRRAWMLTASACDAFSVYAAVYGKALTGASVDELRLYYMTVCGNSAASSVH